MSLEKRWHQENLNVASQYLKEACKKGGDRHFRVMVLNLKRDDKLDMRKQFLTTREVVDTPSLEVFNMRLDADLTNLS